jgi:hypothetical protein
MNISEMAQNYKSATDKFLNAIQDLDESLIDKAIPGEWSARQVIHHVADSEAQSYARLRRLLAEPEGSIIQGYDEGAWADSPLLGYKDSPVDLPIAVYVAVRAASHMLLSRISEADLERSGIHSEAGVYTVADWVRTYTNHPVEHLEQLLIAIKQP